MTSRGTQVLRGWIIASFSVLVAVLAHILGGGSAPSWVAVVLALAFATLASIALIGRRMSLPRLAVAVAISQTFFHTVFAVIGDAGNVVASPSGHHEMSFAVTAGVINHGAHGVWPMMLGHALAAVLTIIALRQSSAALAGITRIAWCVRRSFAKVTAVAVAPVVIRRPRGATLTHFGAIAVLLHTRSSVVSRRGPPAVAAALF